MGPATGLPTRVSPGRCAEDLLSGPRRHQAYGAAARLDVYECFEFGWRAFDIAERLQTPVFVLSDLDIGMNQWMSKPFDYPEEPMDRGKVLNGRGD